MKRNIILSAVVLFFALAMQAAPITGRQALEKAKTFIYGGSDMKFAAGPIKMAVPDDGIQPYYVFNIGNDGGFVIVSGDDAAYPVLGYSRSGHFDVNDMPDNMKVWLDAYAADLKKIQKMNLPAYKARKTRAEKWQKIPKLVTSEWNQTYPYNQQCPKYPGDYEHRPTGCVATAMAQVMYFHRWPAGETLAIPGYTFKDDETWGGDGKDKNVEALEPTVFDWDSMTDKYNFSSDKKSEEAVARLMKYAGHSVEMMYGVQASGAFSENIAGAMIQYFGYKNTARIVYRDNFNSQEEWDALMYGELAENRPILYSGVTKDLAGHQFVCDGYEDGFFHINWGWGGMSDGFFKLEILDPYDQGTGGAGTGMAFSEMQSAIIGVQKPVENDCLYVGNVSSEVGAEAQCEIVLKNVRKNYTSMQFDLRLPDGVSVSNDGVGNPKVSFDKSRSEKGDHKVSVGRVSDGSYRFLVYSPSNSMITGKDGALINVTFKVSAGMQSGSYPAEISNVLMCNTKLDDFVINGCQFAIDVTGESLLLGDADENGVVNANDVNKIVKNILYQEDGLLNMKFADVDADGIIDVGDVMLTADIILQNTGADRNIVATETDYNDTFSMSSYDGGLMLGLRNNTCFKAMQIDVTLPKDVALTDVIPSDDRILGFDIVYNKISDGKYRMVIYSLDSRNVSLSDGTIINLIADKFVEEAKVSNITMVTSDLRKMLLNDVDYKVPSGINDVTMKHNDGPAYTLEGLRIREDVKDLKKGIYIINGKKVVVK